MMRPASIISTAGALALGAFLAVSPARAGVLVADGITYTLTETTTSSALTNVFTLSIAGINGPSDAEGGGRYGVQSFAFNPPSNFVSATAPGGFSYTAGGLNSGGCNGHGNFFCFAANTTPTGPALASNSTLSYSFSITLSSGDFTNFAPDFKINWDGTQNNYDLVSQTLTPTLIAGGGGNGGGAPVPEPASLSLLGGGLAALGYIRRRRARPQA